MIFWEALLLTAAGEALGLACGVALSWLLVYVINYQSFGWTFIYAVDWGMLGLSVPLIVGAALVKRNIHYAQKGVDFHAKQSKRYS